MAVWLVLCQIGRNKHSTRASKKWLEHTATSPVPHPTYLPSPATAMCLPSEPTDLLPDIPLEEVPPLYDGRRAALNLNIIIVCAGIGGLAAANTLPHDGHRVTSLYCTHVLGEVGAGIQVSPNATQLLLRWGLG